MSGGAGASVERSGGSAAAAREHEGRGGDALGALPLSVAIVCKNNEKTIGRTLESVRGLARQIVAVDSGSTDGTIALLEKHGAEVVRSEWLGHIRTKQKALELCAQEWVLCLDSDESLEPELRVSVERAVRGDDAAFVAYEVNRKIWWDGVWLHHAWQPEWRVRLVRRGAARWGGYDPHDALLPEPGKGRVGRLKGDLRHESIGTMGEFLMAQVRHAQRAAESYFAAGRRTSGLWLVVSPVAAFFKQLVIKRAFMDGWRGWAAASSTAVSAAMKHMVLLEMQGKGKRRGGQGRGGEG